MADFKVSQLSTTTSAVNGDYFIINKGNTKTSRINFTDLVTVVGGGLDTRYVKLNDGGTKQSIIGNGGLTIAGNVGIGKNNPGEKLDVNGTARVTDAVLTNVKSAELLATDSDGKIIPTSAAAAPGNGALTVKNHGDTTNSTGTFTANQSGNSTLTLPQIQYGNIAGTPPAPGNGALTIRNHGDTTNSTGTFTANQSGPSTLTLPQVQYANISGTPAGDFLRVDSSAPAQTRASTNIVNFTGAFGIGPSTNRLQLTPSSDTLFVYKGTAKDYQMRFVNTSGDNVFTINVRNDANQALHINRFGNTGGGNANIKGQLTQLNLQDCKNISGGSTNSSNLPACYASSIQFNSASTFSSYSVFNVQSIRSDTPGSTTSWNTLNGFVFNKNAIGYNDGTSDIALVNTTIHGIFTELTNNGECSGSTDVWASYHNGDAPTYNGGTVKLNRGIEFGGDRNSPTVNSNLYFGRYEKGTYTPEMTGSDTAITYGTRTGWYVISGDLCTVGVDIVYSNASGNSGIEISLPVQPQSLNGTMTGISGDVVIVDAATNDPTPLLLRASGSATATTMTGGTNTSNTNGSKWRYTDAPEGRYRAQITYTV